MEITNIKKTLIIIASIIYSTVLINCWNTGLPYSYFMFVRVAGFILFGYLAYYNYNCKNESLCVLCAMSCLLINPILKVHLLRITWLIIDLLFILLLISNSVYILIHKNKQHTD